LRIWIVIAFILATLIAKPARSAEYLFYNGLWSALPVVGGGVRKIVKDVREAGFPARQFAYLTPVEGYYLAWHHSVHFCNRHKDGDLEGPIVLVGHSFGGEIIARMARNFEECGIEVDYAAFIDTPIIWPLGDNVKKIDNFRASISIMNGRVNLQEGVSVPVNEFTYPVGHVSIAYMADVRLRIVSQIEEIEAQ